MKPFLNLRKSKVWLSIGWYRVEPFKLFSITLCEAPTNAFGDVDFIALFDLQITKLCVSFGFYV